MFSSFFFSLISLLFISVAVRIQSCAKVHQTAAGVLGYNRVSFPFLFTNFLCFVYFRVECNRMQPMGVEQQSIFSAVKVCCFTSHCCSISLTFRLKTGGIGSLGGSESYLPNEGINLAQKERGLEFAILWDSPSKGVDSDFVIIIKIGAHGRGM